MVKDVMNLAVVNFHAVWGDKECNLKRILEFSKAAGKRGADMVVFPETALSGYGDDPATTVRAEKMHAKVAETIPGPSTQALAEVAKKYDMYIIIGMPEQDADKPDVVYNSAAIIHPDGKFDSYRKTHLPFAEGNWSVRGDMPVLFDTPWGPVGVTICYDTYCFPELIRYYRAKGCRLVLNVTACPDVECTRTAAKLTIPAYVSTDYVFIASSNLVGRDNPLYFHGGSCVVGPRMNERGAGEPYTYIGKMFDTPESDNVEMFLGTIDLHMADVNTQIPIHSVNPGINEPDFRPEMYIRMHEDLLASGRWKK